MKKDLQKTIGAIRKDEQKTKNTEFPKAMMTKKQEANRTATVNCGGEWRTKEATLETANKVMNDERFTAFLEKHNAVAKIEVNNFDTYQIRITF